ncbi:MAG: rhomboid family intramembrane serine protease [Pirellulaceae bacterium]
MRFLAEIEGQRNAELFVAHLLTEECDTHIELAREGSDLWEIWVRDEDKLDFARDELSEFLTNTGAAKYEAAMLAARKILQEKERRQQEVIKNTRKSTPSKTSLGRGGKIPPLTLALLVTCIVLGFVTGFGSPNSSLGVNVMNGLSFVTPQDYDESAEDPAASIKQGEIWRILTPAVLHGDIIHLAMNMFMFVSFGRIVERWIGTPKFAVLVFALMVLPNLFQGLSPDWMRGSPFFVGLSGVVYGLIGFVWIRSTINPSHGISIPFPMVVLLVGVIVIGMARIIPGWNLADLCHLGGLLVGCGAGFLAEQADG